VAGFVVRVSQADNCDSFRLRLASRITALRSRSACSALSNLSSFFTRVGLVM
jgi:hypothetical protein